MRISLIAAVARNGVIGRGLELPWRLSSDLKRFKSLTMGHHVAMGRKTFDSIGRPLPGRRIVVLTRRRPKLPDGVLAASSVDEAVTLAEDAGESELFVAGGGEIYAAALPRAHRLYLTEVEAEVDGDVHFPAFDRDRWRLLRQDRLPAGPRDEHATVFTVYERAPQ